MSLDDGANRGRGWIAWFVVGILANPNVAGPAVKLATGAGLSPITWQSLTAVSFALLGMAALLFTAARVQRVRPLLFVYILVFALLVASEVALRIVRPPGALIQEYGYPPGLLVPDAEVGRVYRPGFTGHFTFLAYRDVPIRINSLGFRDDEPDPAARRRVIVLGDSIAFGAGVRAQDRFSDVLEQMLDRTGPPVDVVDWGINGTETNHQRLLYDRLADTLAHDVVLVAFCLNDVVSVPAADLYEKTARKSKPAATWGDRLGEKGLSLHYLFTLRLAETGIDAIRARSGAAGTEADRKRTEYERFLARHWADDAEVARLKDELAAIRDEAAARGARTVIAIFPYRFQFRSADFSPQRKLTAIAADLGVSLVDLSEPFAATGDPDSLYLRGDDCHPDVRGHRIAAEAIAPAIEDALRTQPKADS